MFRFFLSWRYLRARATNLIGILGVFVGVGALVLILSIMTGFLEESRRTVRGSLADVIVMPAAERIDAPRSPALLLAIIREDPRVAGAAAQLVWYGMLFEDDGTTSRLLTSPSHGDLGFVQLVGVDVSVPLRLVAPALRVSAAALGARLPLEVQDELDATALLSALVYDEDELERGRGAPVAQPLLPFAPPPGYDPPGRPKAPVVVGEQLFWVLGLRVGDEIDIGTGVADPKTGELAQSNRRFVVAGTARSGDNEADRRRIYLDRRELADFLGGSLEFSQIVVRVADYEQQGDALVADLRRELAAAGLIAGGVFERSEVYTWEELRGNLLGAIANERTLMAIMLSLVLLVAGFTIFAILSMMVTEKRRDIGVLTALGATPTGVLQTFLLIALWDALLGALVGAALGTWAAIELDAIERWLSAKLGIQIFNRDVYLFDHIPTVVEPLAVLGFVLLAVACALAFAALPAWRAARLHPLDALRYE